VRMESGNLPIAISTLILLSLFRWSASNRIRQYVL
jgi:hypothetical protein